MKILEKEKNKKFEKKRFPLDAIENVIEPQPTEQYRIAESSPKFMNKKIKLGVFVDGNDESEGMGNKVNKEDVNKRKN